MDRILHFSQREVKARRKDTLRRLRRRLNIGRCFADKRSIAEARKDHARKMRRLHLIER